MLLCRNAVFSGLPEGNDGVRRGTACLKARVCVIQQAHPVPVTPHAVGCNRRRHFPQDFDEAQWAVVRERSIVTSFVDITYEINMPAVRRDAGVLDDIR